ncbi:hypothetical protein [Paraburkholderia steynii]|uniref:hypothetical protein n=1 Tax=Paraburkholderia steynii TaxID=1245441 RepID=UPI00116009BA|nr:hypothetical protein [Paraburkholderia steynii]
MAGFIILVVLLSQAQNGRLRFPSPRYLSHPFLATYETPWAASSGMASTIARYLPTRGRMAATEPRAAFAEVLLRKAAMGRLRKVGGRATLSQLRRTGSSGFGQFGTFDMAPQIVDNAAVFRCERTVGTRVCQATIGVEIDYVTYRFSQ